MFILHADKNHLIVRQQEMVTSGSVNTNSVRFEFSPDWDGLEKTAVFRAGNQTVSVLLDEDTACVVPWEVLSQHGKWLSAGVYGTGPNGTVLPTIWAGLGMVQKGAEPMGETQPPDSNLWKQELAGKGDRLGYTETGWLGLYAGDKLLSGVSLNDGGECPFVAAKEEVDEMLNDVFGVK